MRIPKHLPTKLVIPLLMLSVIGTAAAAFMLFTHTFPALQTVVPPAALTTQCTTLVFNVAAVNIGSTGSVRAECLVNGAQPAFSSTGGTFIPSFTLPTTYTGVFIVASDPGIPCAGLSGPFLNSGTPITIATGNYDYCLNYQAPQSGTLPTFDLTWSQVT